MNQTIKLTSKQAKSIVKSTFPEYCGRKFTLKFQNQVTFYDTNASGGTVNKYCGIRANGEAYRLVPLAPWVNSIEGQTIELPDDMMVVEHSYFCGKDCGITIYANLSHLPKWIEQPQDVTH